MHDFGNGWRNTVDLTDEEKRQKEECPLAFLCSYHNTTEGGECAAYKTYGYRSCMHYELVALWFEQHSE